MNPSRPLVALAALLAVGCIERLPPPEAPSRELSAELAREAIQPAPEGQGRLVLDVVDGAARVEDLGSEADGAGGEEICPATPCVVSLAVGEHTLFFHQGGRDDRVRAEVTAAPRAHRRVMSFDSGAHGEYLALAVGGLTLAAVMSPVLDPLLRAQDFGGPEIGLSIAAGIGGVALVVGIGAIIAAIVDPQRTRDGASTEWELE